MATAAQLTWSELVFVAGRTGVTNWRDPASGAPGRLVLAPSSQRGRQGSMGSVVGCVRHHTGTPEAFRAADDYPTYQIVKEGRAGLVNSLSAYGLGRWTGLYVFSEFISWHAGAWSWLGITDGNGHFLGIEAEGTGLRWTPFQREFYPRLCASILSFVGEGPEYMPRHLDGAVPHGRKADAANLWEDFTGRVQWYLGDLQRITYRGSTTPVTPIPLPEDDMLYVHADDGNNYLFGDGYAEHITEAADNVALKAKFGPAVPLTAGLVARMLASSRAVSSNTLAIARDLADEEPAPQA